TIELHLPPDQFEILKAAEESERETSPGWSGKSHERGCDRVAGEDEGRGRACIALPRAGNRTRLGSQARPEKKSRRFRRLEVCETGRCQSPKMVGRRPH